MSKLICETCGIVNCECVPYDVECDSCRRAYQQGRRDAIEEIGDSMTFHQDGLSGYFTISIDEWEKLEEKENDSKRTD